MPLAALRARRAAGSARSGLPLSSHERQLLRPQAKRRAWRERGEGRCLVSAVQDVSQCVYVSLLSLLCRMFHSEPDFCARCGSALPLPVSSASLACRSCRSPGDAR
ncbi:unnamed protein product, partial [Lampetra planeri]